MTENKANKKKRRWTIGAMVVFGMCLAVGCAKFNTERGVENRWRASGTPEFTSGTTTQADVLKALGPPSQIISMNNGSILYYLKEQGSGAGLILLVYNQVEYTVRYDRAIFFFDRQGVLTDYAYSHEDSPSE